MLITSTEMHGDYRQTAHVPETHNKAKQNTTKHNFQAPNRTMQTHKLKAPKQHCAYARMVYKLQNKSAFPPKTRKSTLGFDCQIWPWKKKDHVGH